MASPPPPPVKPGGRRALSPKLARTFSGTAVTTTVPPPVTIAAVSGESTALSTRETWARFSHPQNAPSTPAHATIESANRFLMTRLPRLLDVEPSVGLGEHRQHRGA